MINAGPTDAISLHGLTIEGGGVGATGIVFSSGKSLIILAPFATFVSGIALHTDRDQQASGIGNDDSR